MTAMEIADEAVEAAARAYYTHLGWDWEDLASAAADHDEDLAQIVSEFQVALQAAMPHLSHAEFDRGFVAGLAAARKLNGTES